MSKFLGYAVVWTGKSGNTFVTSGLLTHDRLEAQMMANQGNCQWPELRSFVVEVHETETSAVHEFTTAQKEMVA